MTPSCSVETRKTYYNFTILSMIFFNVDLNSSDKILMGRKEGVLSVF